MIIKYGINISDENYDLNLKRLTNQIYKLLPMREENQDWKKFLETVMLEIGGLNELVGTTVNFLPLLSKLESLYDIEDFIVYRKTIFECLGLIDKVK